MKSVPAEMRAGIRGVFGGESSELKNSTVLPAVNTGSAVDTTTLMVHPRFEAIL